MKHSIRSSGWSRPFVVSSALLAIAACDQATPSDGGDELAVEDASKSDRPVACKARSDIDFTVVDGVAAGDGFAADSDVRKIIKTRATFEKYFGADAPDVDFAKDWVYVWAAPESAAGGTASIERRPELSPTYLASFVRICAATGRRLHFYPPEPEVEDVDDGEAFRARHRAPVRGGPCRGGVVRQARAVARAAGGGARRRPRGELRARARGARLLATLRDGAAHIARGAPRVAPRRPSR